MKLFPRNMAHAVLTEFYNGEKPPADKVDKLFNLMQSANQQKLDWASLALAISLFVVGNMFVYFLFAFTNVAHMYSDSRLPTTGIFDLLTPAAHPWLTMFMVMCDLLGLTIAAGLHVSKLSDRNSNR